jgi:predicted O-methyltransferase YrrM
MAEALRSAVPGSLRPLAVFNSGEPYWRSWAHLAHAVRTGQPAFEHVHGMDFFSYYRQHPEEWALFDQMMAAQTAAVTRTVAAAYDFSRVRTVVDVGGGNGTLVLGLLAAHPHLHGVVFDQPAVAARAEEAIAAAGLADRCQAVGGDFFVAVPEGGEAYLLKYILHDWDDERSIAILRACRQAMPADGRLLVIELLIPPGNNPSYAKSQDVNMLTNLGGRERTVEEYGTLFTAAGFALTETIPIQGELHLIEGAPA